MNALQASNFLHTLAETDFNKYTIQSEEGQLIAIIPKTTSFFSGTPIIDPEKFDQAITKIIDLIHTNPDLLASKSVQSDLCKISQNLMSHVNEISSPIEGHKAYTKISQISSEALLYLWGQSKSNINESIDSLPLDVNQKNVIRNQFIEKDGEVFLRENILCISSKFLREAGKDSIKKMIRTSLDQYPDISSIQIQGYPSITRRGMQELLRRNVPLNLLGIPFKAAGFNDSKTEIPIHPTLLFKSEFFMRFLDFSSKAGSLPKKSLITPIPISTRAFELINREDLGSIEIDSNNVMELFHAANYLGIPSLLKKCDKALSRSLQTELTVREDDRLAIKIAKILRELERMEGIQDLPELRALCEEKIHQWITLKPQPDRIVHCLETIQRLKIPLKSLDLSNFHVDKEASVVSTMLSYIVTPKAPPFLTDKDLIRILEACPTTLTGLNLSNNPKISSEIGPRLTRFPQLQKLGLAGTKLPNFGQYLGKLTHLRELDLSHSNVTGVSPHIANLTDLETLNLNGCLQQAKSIIPYLSSLTKLKALNLSNCAIDDSIVPGLKTLKTLHELIITEATVTKKVGEALKELEQLRHLTLSGCKEITDDLISNFIPLKHLKILNISNCPKLTDEMGESLRKLTELEELNLSNTKVTSLIGISIFKLKNLHTLSLEGCSQVGNNIIKPLIKLPKLQVLNLANCPRLTSSILPSIEEFPKLKLLNITKCHKIKDSLAALAHLRRLKLIQ